MNIFVIGSGTFGTAISNELARNTDNNITIYSRSVEIVNEINSEKTNKKYFANTKLADSLKCTSKFIDIKSADVIFIALPSSAIIQVIDDFKEYISSSQLIVNLSKGIFKNGQTIVDYLNKVLKNKNIVSLKGPSFAVEIMQRANTLLTLGYTDVNQFQIVKEVFNNTRIYLDITKDIRGVEILSVIKNIYALLIGVIDAKYNSPNTRFMFMTKVFSEIRILNKEFGGDLDTVFLACGLGDVSMTSLNDLSRNRTLGLLIGKGFYNPNSNDNTVIVEGVNSINIIFNMIGASLQNQLPLLKKLHEFFNSNSKKFSINFKELFLQEEL